VYCNIENPKKLIVVIFVDDWLICAKDKAKIEEMVEHMDKAFDITRCAISTLCQILLNLNGEQSLITLTKLKVYEQDVD
jgi:hypothetical protein